MSIHIHILLHDTVVVLMHTFKLRRKCEFDLYTYANVYNIFTIYTNLIDKAFRKLLEKKFLRTKKSITTRFL